MTRIAVFRGTTEDDGQFIGSIKHPYQNRHRFHVELFVKTSNGDLLKDEITTKGPVQLNDLLEDTVKPSIDELIAEANKLGGTKKYGFDIFKWR